MSKNGRFTHLAFFTLTIVLGMQAKRMFIPLLLYVMRDNLGASANIAGILAFVVFATSFLIGIMRQQFGTARMWRYPAMILGPLLIIANLFYGIIQPTQSPLITLFPLFLTILAVAAFLQFLPHYLIHQRQNLPFFVFGLLFGLGFDMALHGAVQTYDFVWHNLIGLLLLFAAQLAFLLLCGKGETNGRTIGVRWAWGIMVIGPYLFLQMFMFQNVARLTAVTGWSQAWTLAWMVLGHMVGLITAVTISQRRSSLLDWLPFTLLLLLSPVGQFDGWFAAAQHLAGQIGSAALLTLILLRLGTQESGERGTRTFTLAYGLGFVIYNILTFAYYIGYDIYLPIANTTFVLIGAIVIAVIALLGMRNQAASTASGPKFRLILPAVLLLFPLYAIATQKTAESIPGTGYPVRVMTYNTHNGFHPYGFLDLEAIAQVIEDEGADVVALQEVARGWIINGSNDMLIWLSRRLDMPYISGPTADPLWGNALLSRYPITSYELLPLPDDDIALRRGFIAAEIDLGNNDSLNVIVTHLHHPPEFSDLRQEQVQAIIEYVQGDDQTIIMGDFNATPDTPEIALLRDAGYLDILVDVEPNYTYSSLNPDQQIDYIWLTPDLTAESIHIPPEPASDHLGVAATIRP